MMDLETATAKKADVVIPSQRQKRKFTDEGEVMGAETAQKGDDDEEPTDEEGSNKKEGVLEVYYDLERGIQTYNFNGCYVRERIHTEPYAEALADLYRPFKLAGLKKIPVDRPPPRPKLYHERDFKGESRRETAEVIEDALRFYNKKHHTNYKLVEPLGKDKYYEDAIGNWVHVNFTAKPEADLNGGNGDSSTKLFFAERHCPKSGCCMVTACCILDGVKTTKKCGICHWDTDLLHPTRGFCLGINTPRKRVLRSRTIPGIV